MPSPDRDPFLDARRRGAVTRRDLIRLGAAAGLSLTPARRVSAQAGTPATPVNTTPTGAAEPGGRSINREEYHRLLHDTFDLGSPAVTGGRAIYGATSDIDTLHPHLAFDVFSGWVAGNIFEALAGINPTNGFPAPGLADFWELATDGITYTFHLNPGASWHDGQPVTAADVVFSFDTALDEASLAGFQATVGRALVSYRAIDDHTVELVATSSLATFVESTAALVTILPKHVWEPVPLAAWGSDPGTTGQDPTRVVGSGPFRFEEWVAGDHVTLARNDSYWVPAAVPAIDEFILRVIPEPSNQVAALTTGEIDFARIPVAEADALDNEPDLAVITYDNPGWILLNINQNPDVTELFVDTTVRRALMYALDRDLMAEEIFLGYATRADGVQPPLSVGYAPDRIDTIYDYDPAKAIHLLEEAGWVDADGDGIRERNGVPFGFDCLYAENVTIYRQMVTYIQQAWNDVGIAMQPAPMSFQTLGDALGTGDYAMAFHGIQWGVDGNLGDMFRCDAAPPAGFNAMGFCNARYDALDALQVAELDVDRRIDLLVEQANILNDEVAAGVLLFPQALIGHRTTLRNFLPNGYSFMWSMPWWWIEEA